MTFEEWFKHTFGYEPNLHPGDYDNDIKFKMAYEAGYRKRDDEINKFYNELMK